ncbi:hypothetical protein QNM97_23175 [Gordonia sp. L191]|uniref:hypothetical protein n=1 Tax=Gordonia sp. L191 TaxID=2982699 RepID=UPI0024C0C21F|nr:hypothetical protein [Gordonia sp. L191]WHU46834.1 hypothetical protein QNM97_23175 [Gordonia sp. L191]
MGNSPDWAVLERLNAAAVIGEVQFKPAELCAVEGRPLRVDSRFYSENKSVISSSKEEPTYWISTLFDQLQSQLRSGEALFGLYYRTVLNVDHVQAFLLLNTVQLADLEVQFLGSMSRRGFVAYNRMQAESYLSYES